MPPSCFGFQESFSMENGAEGKKKAVKDEYGCFSATATHCRELFMHPV
jgi:hypothetical protein